jgi:hypothetical protein
MNHGHDGPRRFGRRNSGVATAWKSAQRATGGLVKGRICRPEERRAGKYVLSASGGRPVYMPLSAVQGLQGPQALYLTNGPAVVVGSASVCGWG